MRTAALVMLALWVLATAHCRLEQVPGLEFLSCCLHVQVAPHADDDCESDACAIVESGFYKLEDQQLFIPAHLILV